MIKLFPNAIWLSQQCPVESISQRQLLSILTSALTTPKAIAIGAASKIVLQLFLNMSHATPTGMQLHRQDRKSPSLGICSMRIMKFRFDCVRRIAPVALPLQQ